MRKLLLAVLAAGTFALLAVAGVGGANANMAANYTKIPDVNRLVGSDVQTVDYYISRKYYNGCYRDYYCKYRSWYCGPYGCDWNYSRCYYGGCVGGYGGGGGGGYGGYRRGY